MAFPVDYKYKAKLTIVTRPSSTLTDFTVLLNKDNLPSAMMDSDGSTPALEGGGDIRFSSDAAGATQLPCDVQQFERNTNPANAKVEIFVKIPSVSSSADTDFYVWWGGPDTSQPADNTTYGAENAWDSNYKGIWHLTEGWGTDSDRFKEATSQNKHGTGSVTGSVNVAAVAGKWGGQGLECTNLIQNTTYWKIAINGGSPYNVNARGKTFEAWISWPAETSHGWYWSKGDTNGDEMDMRGLGRAGASPNWGKQWWNRSGGDNTVQGTTSHAANTWHHVAWVVDSNGGVVLYVDGSSDGSWSSGTIDTSSGTKTMYLGVGAGDVSADDEGWEGKIDEVRMSFSQRDSAWIGATYATLNNPAGYITEGTVQQTISGTGIASAEAFGTAKINRSISGTGIVSQETIGTLTVNRGNVTISGAGAIATAEAAGTPKLNFTIYPGKIQAEEAWPTPRIIMKVIANGIASGETFGTTQVNLSIAGTGIASAETFGIPVLNLKIYIQGITSAEAFGNLRTNIWIVFAGDIASLEAFGTPALSYEIEPFAIPTAELFGTARLNQEVLATAVDSAETFGEPVVGNLMRPAGIASAELFGTAVLQRGNVFVRPPNITSEEAFGTTSVRRMVYASGFDDGSALGIPTVNRTIHAPGIVSAESFGTARISERLQPAGITSQEAFGSPFVDYLIHPPAIPSAESFGAIKINLTIQLQYGISSTETFGSVSVVKVISNAGAIPSEEQFGSVAINFRIGTLGIPSAEWFGTANFIQPQFVTDAGGITSTENFGTAIIFYDQIITIDAGIDSAETVGNPTCIIFRQNRFFDRVQTDLEQGMLNTNEFGENGIYISTNGETLILSGIFDNEYRTIDAETGIGVMSTQPVFWCSTRQFKTAPGPRDKMRIRGVNYQVIRHEPDGTGLSMLFLHHEKTV